MVSFAERNYYDDQKDIQKIIIESDSQLLTNSINDKIVYLKKH